ncbi:MAG: histidine phosphatase family protein [Magnetococcales bacterium]|nr:histidine phosphatase family protein [Magnetococcales bacterium]
MKIRSSAVGPPTLVDLLRHGEPEGGTRYRGSVNDPLSTLGWDQMRCAVLRKRAWTRIVTSPLCRCSDFARELSDKLTIPLTIDDRLQELNFGRWEGRTAEDILTSEDEHLLRSFWEDPLNNPPPEGEHLSQLQERVLAAWDDTLAMHDTEHLLLIAHSGVLRIIIASITCTPLHHLSRLMLPMASIVQVRVDQLKSGPLPRIIFNSDHD